MADHIVVIGRIHALAGFHGELDGLLLDTEKRTRKQDGCLRCDFASDLASAGEYIFVQEWLDQAALDAHYRSVEFTDYQQAVAPMLARPTSVRQHTVSETIEPVSSSPMDPRDAD